jgi:hypothetical protein
MKKTYLKPEGRQAMLDMDYHLCIGSSNKKNPASGLGDDENLQDGGNNPGDFSRRNVWGEDVIETEDF